MRSTRRFKSRNDFPLPFPLTCRKIGRRRIMQVETRTRAAIVLVLAFTSIVAAQEPLFRARTDLVLVPVSVTDEKGRFVHGLTAGDFEISEDGARRAVKQFTAARVPVSHIILLDISGSMMQGP